MMSLMASVSQVTIMYFTLIMLVTAVSSWFGMRWLTQFLQQKGVVDRPNGRSMHAGEVPRGGGIIIVLLILICVLILALISDRTLFFCGLGVLLLGWAGLSLCDDMVDLSPRLRFSVQAVLASSTVFLFGWVGTAFGVELGLAGPLVTVLGVLWMANLNNFMDGMDGLAASQAIIASLTLGIWFLYLGDQELALVCAVTLAANYGFLLWNWYPAKIFMGDVGSISLGALYGTLIIVAANRHDIPVLSVLLVFAVFVVDATFTVLNRVRKGERFWLPHRSHFYQRAALAGVPHNKIVLMAILLMTVCSLFATLTVLYRGTMAPLLVVVLLLLVAAGFCIVQIEKNQQHDD